MARPTLIEQAQYMSREQVADELGMNPDTLVRLMNGGLLPLARRNVNGVWLFTPTWLEKARAQLNPRA